MRYSNWSDNFQHSFPGGRFKSYQYLGGNVVQFYELKINSTAEPISLATVVYNQNGRTWVIDESNGETIEVTPLTAREYSAWKETQYENML